MQRKDGDWETWNRKGTGWWQSSDDQHWTDQKWYSSNAQHWSEQEWRRSEQSNDAHRWNERTSHSNDAWNTNRWEEKKVIPSSPQQSSDPSTASLTGRCAPATPLGASPAPSTPQLRVVPATPLGAISVPRTPREALATPPPSGSSVGMPAQSIDVLRTTCARSNCRITGIDSSGEYARGSELPAYKIDGFVNQSLDGIYIRDPMRQLHGVLANGSLYPTSSYWNRNSPPDQPVFMYWQYYKDHHAICPQFARGEDDYWRIVSSGSHLGEYGPGLAFFKHTTKQWFEHDGQAFVPRSISFVILQENEIPAATGLGPAVAPSRLLPSRCITPSAPCMRTPGLPTPHSGTRTPGLPTPHGGMSTPGLPKPHSGMSTPGLPKPHSGMSTPGLPKPHSGMSTPGMRQSGMTTPGMRPSELRTPSTIPTVLQQDIKTEIVKMEPSEDMASTGAGAVGTIDLFSPVEFASVKDEEDAEKKESAAEDVVDHESRGIEDVRTDVEQALADASQAEIIGKPKTHKKEKKEKKPDHKKKQKKHKSGEKKEKKKKKRKKDQADSVNGVTAAMEDSEWTSD